MGKTMLAGVSWGKSRWFCARMSWPLGRVEITDQLMIEGLEVVRLRPQDVEVIELRWVMPIGGSFQIKHRRPDLPGYLAFATPCRNSKISKELSLRGFNVVSRKMSLANLPTWAKILTVVVVAAGISGVLAGMEFGTVGLRAGITIATMLVLAALMRL